MKKAVKIILSIVIILAVAAAAVCYWQRDNLAALRMSLSTPKDDLSQMITDNDKRVTDAAKKVDGVVVRDLTEEEKAALRDETLSREELLDRLTSGETPSDSEVGDTSGDNAGEVPAASPAPDAPAVSVGQEEQTPVSGTADSTNQDKLSRYLAEIYLMKAEYTNWLEEKYAAAIEEYSALDESEHTTVNKYKIGMSYMSEALKKEKECDARMAELEDEILALLTEMGEDTSLVDDIKAAYTDEKALKKAYYLGLHS